MLVLLLSACTTPGDPADTGPTYYRDVRPILDNSCARCHTDRGLSTSFDDPASVQSLATSIQARTQAGTMPPPAPDPSCADYDGSDALFLSDEDKQLLSDWADAGAPLGDPATAPAAGPPLTTAPFDTELRGTAPYQPTFDETGNDYRCFVLDVGNTTAAYVTGFEALVDNPRIVHHIVLWNVAASVDLPAETGGEIGFACDGFGEGGWDFFAGWAPGGRPFLFDEGQGMKIRAASRLVLQMHYYESFEGAAAELDQSGFGLHLEDEVDTEIFALPLGVEDFQIPAGQANAEEEMFVPWSEDWAPVTIVGVFPHMHLLGTGFDFNVQHSDGSNTCVVEMNDWDFHNQQAVHLDEPVRIEGGDIVTVTCHYDNSATNPNQPVDPPQDVSFGEGTSDEMCYGFTYGY
ncbi:MAG: hypothetical protein Q8P18_29035 [Pseudomonadota bacterium]|nr:hypothetical protein [Pseudomonadota bacterium]